MAPNAGDRHFRVFRVPASVFQVPVGGDGRPLADVLRGERAPMDALHRRSEAACPNARQCIRSGASLARAGTPRRCPWPGRPSWAASRPCRSGRRPAAPCRGGRPGSYRERISRSPWATGPSHRRAPSMPASRAWCVPLPTSGPSTHPYPMPSSRSIAVSLAVVIGCGGS